MARCLAGQNHGEHSGAGRGQLALQGACIVGRVVDWISLLLVVRADLHATSVP
jgi:hypothetical protein